MITLYKFKKPILVSKIEEINSPKRSIFDPLWAFPFKLIWKIIRIPVKIALSIIRFIEDL